MIATQAQREGMGWRQAAVWVAANLLGWVAGLWLGAGLGWGIAERLDGALGEPGAAALGWLAGGLVGGAIVGALQAAVLRERGVAVGPWVAATAGGLGLGMAVVIPLLVILETQGADSRAIALMPLAGLILAAAQWLVLRRALPGAWWWLPAGALGLMLLFLCGVLLGGEGRELIAIVAGGLAYAVATGGALATLLRKAGR
jgi:hypothetical protein